MADMSLDELLSSSLKSAAEPAASAGVADAIRSRVAAGDAGTSVAGSTAPGWGGGAAGILTIVAPVALIVVAGVVGGALGASGLLRPDVRVLQWRDPDLRHHPRHGAGVHLPGRPVSRLDPGQHPRSRSGPRRRRCVPRRPQPRRPHQHDLVRDRRPGARRREPRHRSTADRGVPRGDGHRGHTDAGPRTGRPTPTNAPQPTNQPQPPSDTTPPQTTKMTANPTVVYERRRPRRFRSTPATTSASPL